mmetsp:Transcript_8714/g.18540  ORF Transcript_8714/g.18540 Transcript_8714/m.18540 type:complete len:1163 (-) Transcript_8714:938-4426(-)
MAKGKEAPSAKASTGKKDGESLQADVKAFASQLGLSSAGAGGSFDDFAPSKAKLPIGSNAKPAAKEAKKQKLTHDKDSKEKSNSGRRHETQQGGRAGHHKHAHKGNQGSEQRNQQFKGQQQHEDPRVKSREWNFGVGPRPGEERGFKSLLGKDDATIWYEAASALPPLPAPAAEQDGEPDLDQVERLRQEGEQLIENEVQAFDRELQRRNAADYRWIQQVKRSGTTADRVAAMTLMIQESATANMKSLDTLMSWVQKRKGGRDVVRAALEALQELFLTVLLPDRRLRTLEQQPIKSLPAGKAGHKHLLLWCVEDAIKRRYGMFITALEECSRDNLDFLKEKATKTMYDLLVKKPEGEARLLSGLVNKLGDPSRKIASKAGYLMSQLLLQHPAMKPVVVREVERFLFRPGLQDRARYYAVVFLNQMVLSHKESEGGAALARKMVDLYFTLFRLVVEGHIGRAVEVRKAQEARYAEEKKKWRRQVNKQQAQGKGTDKPPRKPPKKPKKAEAEEMDARMLSALLTGVRRAFPYVAPEEVEPLVEAHGGRLFRMVHTAPFSVGVQALMLMFQLMSSRNAISDRFYRALYSVLLSDGPITSNKTPMFLALLFKAMKADVSVKRVAAFAKRLLQVAHMAAPNFACAVLFLVSEVLKVQPALWSAVSTPEDVAADGETFKDSAAPDTDDEGDGVEVFKDLPASDDEEDSEEGGAGGKQQAREAAGPASTSGREGSTPSSTPSGKWPQQQYYDMHKREPLYCNAERACFWELASLASHAHPSVSAMARTLMSGATVLYDGDPLKDHTLTAFLDKFLLKKPKAHARGSSLMQPLVPQGQDNKSSAADVNSAAFSALAETQVQPADLFLHRFFNLHTVKGKRAVREEARKRRREDEAASDDEDTGDAELEEFMNAQEKAQDDDMGDPDVGYDYDQLAAAMMDGEEDAPGSDDAAEDDEEEEDEEGVSDEEQGSDLELGSDDEAGSSDEEEEDEEGTGRRGVDFDAIDALEDSSDEDPDGGLEGYELAPGAEELMRPGKKSKKGVSRSAASREAEPDDDDLEDINIFELPSPDASDDDKSGKKDTKAKKKVKLQAKEFDFDDDSPDGLDDEDSPGARPQKRKRKESSTDLMSAFASADDYEHLFSDEQRKGSLQKPQQGKRRGSQPRKVKIHS